VEKGQFKHFELYNGSIYHYKKGGTLIRKEKVVNGIIQGNPRVNFTEPKLNAAALANDLNFNGWPEFKEVSGLESINLWMMEPKEMDEFKWTELSKFKSLLILYANGRVYRLDDYANYDSLRLAIKQNKGKQTRRQRYSWEGPDPEIKKDGFVHIVDSVKTEVEIVLIPDVDAAFPGGYDKLRLWLNNNLVYPAKVNIEGRVFVSFIVLKDGSIAGVKIEKGLHPDLDKEAKRLVRAMPKWKPAIWNGLDVASRVMLPIVFKL
jgi:protein TonB